MPLLGVGRDCWPDRGARIATGIVTSLPSGQTPAHLGEDGREVQRALYGLAAGAHRHQVGDVKGDVRLDGVPGHGRNGLDGS